MFERFARELNGLNQSGSKFVDYGAGPRRVWIKVRSGASRQQIENAEKALDVTLSPSFKAFFKSLERSHTVPGREPSWV